MGFIGAESLTKGVSNSSRLSASLYEAGFVCPFFSLTEYSYLFPKYNQYYANCQAKLRIFNSRAAFEAARVEQCGIHALRHSFASNLYARGVEVKIISKLLGHASVEITYNRYIHFFESEIDDTLRQAVGA